MTETTENNADTQQGRWWGTSGRIPDRYQSAVDSELPRFLELVEAERRGRSANPAEAALLLLAFARLRPTAHLLDLEPNREDSQDFGQFDAVAILAFAALTRDIKGPNGAAQLAISRWRREPREESPLTDGIVHDVTAQRTVPEVAEFIREFRRSVARASVDEALDVKDLVDKTLEKFSGARSSRSNFDKALLFIMLREMERDDMESVPDSKNLLERILRKPERKSPEGNGIVAALRHLSPAEAIVEDWVTEQFDSPAVDIVARVADLLIDDPEGAKPLASHVVGKWEAGDLHELCASLVKEEDKRCYENVQDAIASRPDGDWRKLDSVVRAWADKKASKTLPRKIDDLLAAIIARGSESTGSESSEPRTIQFLKILCEKIEKSSPRCERKLRRVMAQEIATRSGAEVAGLLDEVRRPSDFMRAAQIINQNFRESLLAVKDVDRFADYLNSMQRNKRLSSITFWALRELSDPTASNGPLGIENVVVADLAVKLYAGDDKSKARAVDLLERFLENEQAVLPETAIAIIKRVKELRSDMYGSNKWKLLLGATIGRWTEGSDRQTIIKILDEDGYKDDVAAIIRLAG